MEDIFISLYCLVDEFCKETIPVWEKHLLHYGLKKRQRLGRLSLAKIMAIAIHFHQSHCRTFKHYYREYVQAYLGHLFPTLVSYPRFVTLMKSVLVPLSTFLQTLNGEETGIYFADSTIIKVCHIKREKQHKLFKDIAKKAKSTIGWFFGFKLHLVINDKGELMAFKLTAGNVDDRKSVPDLMKNIVGKLFAYRGYISEKLTEKLLE